MTNEGGVHAMTLDFEAVARLQSLRSDLFDLIGRLLAVDGYCKSYEGTFSVVLPNYFDERTDSFRDEPFGVKLSCYLIGPSRHYEWFAPTLAGAVDKCEADVRSWMSEMDERLASGDY